MNYELNFYIVKNRFKDQLKIDMEDYQIKNGRSEVTHAILTANTRFLKAKKIESILKHYTHIKNANLLDIGTGSGHIAKKFSELGAKVVSIDLHDLRQEQDGYQFIQVKDQDLPFNDSYFDIVITNHVIEHVEDQQKHLDEIYRVLKPSGVCYLATPSKYTFLEPHYRLLFLSWFNKRGSEIYLKLFKGKVWDIKPLSNIMIKKLINQRFEVNEISTLIMKEPKKYSLDMAPSFHSIFEIIPLTIWKIISPLLPTIILVLKKSD